MSDFPWSEPAAAVNPTSMYSFAPVTAGEMAANFAVMSATGTVIA